MREPSLSSYHQKSSAAGAELRRIIPRTQSRSIVIVIIAILFTFTTLAIRGTSPEELLQTEAQRLDRLLQLALEEAILKGVEYGLEFKPNSYRFLYYDYMEKEQGQFDFLQFVLTKTR